MANNDSDALTTGVLLLAGGAAGYVVGSRIVARWLHGSEVHAAPSPIAVPIVSTSSPPLVSAPTAAASPPQTPASSVPPTPAGSPTRSPASTTAYPSASPPA